MVIVGSLVEEARISRDIIGVVPGVDYQASVRDLIARQRTGEEITDIDPSPFEKLFVLDRGQSEEGYLVFQIPNLNNPEVPHQVEVRVQTGHLPSFVARKVYEFKLTNSTTEESTDLLAPTTHLDAKDLFASNPYNSTVKIGFPDSWSALFSLEHERGHTQNPKMSSKLVASGILKYTAYHMLIGHTPRIHMDSDVSTSIVKDLEFRGGIYISRAGRPITEILAEPLLPTEANAMLDVEEDANIAGLTVLEGQLRFLGMPESETVEILKGARLYAIDGLASYVRFVDENIGKALVDWIREGLGNSY